MADAAAPEHLFLRACRRQPVPRTPVWMMRQAGRYLPAYRATRERAGGFLAMCKTPELACEVTLQPIDQLGFDAAILFSDILIPLEGMGLEIDFTPAPVLANPVAGVADVDRLRVPDPTESVPYVLEAVRMIRRGLAGRVPLIGFCGAPFTLACYAVEGKGSKTWSKAKALLLGRPEVGHVLLDKLARCQAAYLEAQVAAGAEAVQIFDSWAGALSAHDFRELALRYTRQIIDTLRASPTWRGGGVPIIYFVNGCAPYLDDLPSSGADVIGVDWRVDLAEVRRRVGDLAVQGNLDPACLYLAPEPLRQRVAQVLLAAGDTPGHIFNLGHGLEPDMDPERVRLVVESVRELSAK
jgi:uroporphyrinogen decarboxylase